MKLPELLETSAAFDAGAYWRGCFRMVAATMPRRALGYGGPVRRIEADAVEEVLASSSGDFGLPWLAVLQLRGGIVAVIRGTCDVTLDDMPNTTGADWPLDDPREACADIELADTLDELVRLALNADERVRLALPPPGQS